MPTENRRVAAYLPKYIDDRLESFKVERGLKGDSPALITILEEFFGVSQQVAQVGNTPLGQRVDALENKVDDLVGALTQRLQELGEAMKSAQVESLNQLEGSFIGELKSELKSSLLLELRSELFNELQSKPPVSELSLTSPGQLSLLKLKDDTGSKFTSSIHSESDNELLSELLIPTGNTDDSSSDELLNEPSGKSLDGSVPSEHSELRDELLGEPLNNPPEVPFPPNLLDLTPVGDSLSELPSELSKPDLTDIEQKASTESGSSSESKSELQPLPARELSSRFGLHKQVVTNNKNNWKNTPGKFTEWSKTKDPDKIAWEFRSETNLFHPVLEQPRDSHDAEDF